MLKNYFVWGSDPYENALQIMCILCLLTCIVMFWYRQKKGYGKVQLKIRKTPRNWKLWAVGGYSMILFFFLLILSHRSNQTQFSDILNIAGFCLNAFIAYTAFKFVDNFDLKKGYKAEQHKAMLDFVIELCSMNVTFMTKPVSKEIFYSNTMFDFEAIKIQRTQLNEIKAREKKVFLDELAIQKFKRLRNLCSHPYFYNHRIKGIIIKLEFQTVAFSDISNDDLVLSNYHYTEMEVEQFSTNNNFLYQASYPGVGNLNCEKLVILLIDICAAVEKYYVEHMPEFIPEQFKIEGVLYVD